MLNIPIKDYLRETRIFNRRLGIVVVSVGVCVALLFLRLAYLQLVSYRHFATLSQANRIKPLPIPPPRGLILDRNGIVLALNYPTYTLEIIPDQVEDMEVLLDQLGTLVRVTEGDLKLFRKLMRERPRFEPIALRTRLTEEEAARIAVQRPFLTGVELQARLQRHYPFNGLGVHAIGYVSRISETDLDRIDKNTYRGLHHIGKLGIEASYEKVLLGQAGFEKVETNAHGRSIRVLERVAPIAGKNLRLNLDARLQALVEQELGTRRGAVIATEPATGAVLAFVSTPTYDPNAFVNGIDTASYKALLNDPDKPLINRALNGQYSPGSTIKAFLGIAALESGGRFDSNRAIACDGSFNLPGSRHQFRDWKKGGHGMVTLHEAIVQSCDVYFYKLAVALEIGGMRKFLAPFGFGTATGADLIGESLGLLPSPQWKTARGQPWYPGDTVITGIGQGLILATPLQLASGIGAIAQHGRRMKPMLVQAYEDPRTRIVQPNLPQIANQITLQDPHHFDTVIGHLTDVVHSPHGTAVRSGMGAKYRIAGKTGTAQVKGIAQGAHYSERATPERLRDHALFVAFAPADNPKVAVAVIVENGGHGSSAAAPIARKIMDHVILGAEVTATDATPKIPPATDGTVADEE